MGKSQSAPDPYATAAAQTQSNQQTANYNADLNRVSQYTPYGSSVYTQTGSTSSGAPQYRQDITLAPLAQQELDNELQQNADLSKLGYGLYNQASSTLANPVSTNGLPALSGGPNQDFNAATKAASDAVYNQATSRLDPMWQNNQNDLNSALANQGIVQGSDAYNRAQDQLSRNKNDAYNQAAYSAQQAGLAAEAQGFGQAAQGAQMDNAARAQGLQEQSTLATIPLNQLNALRSGTQITNPQFTAVPQSNAAGTDISGDIYKSAQLDAANSNAFMNGLFSLGAAGLSVAKFSDRRLKRDVQRVGTAPRLRLPLYRFRYLWDDAVHVGVMAQDVLRVRPQAVGRIGDFYAVDYGQIS